RYVERIAPALAEIRSASEEASTGSDVPSGTLRINAPHGAAYLLLEPLFSRYAARYPQVRIDIVSESRMVDVVAGGFDAGIRLAEAVPQDMIAVPLSRDTRMLVVAT
ncbi:LysR substrate-binding domain-containing protein, partial [Escherichia coli]|uniref:LysR substrate-binding domain-containing protein n=1 Tax=Escherichia coli TaxID=562 RepID=UPI0022808069